MKLLDKIRDRRARRIVRAELSFPNDGFRRYPNLEIEFGNKTLYRADLQALSDSSEGVGRYLERERILEAMGENSQPPQEGEPSSFTNIAFESGVIWERQRIIKIIAEKETN